MVEMNNHTIEGLHYKKFCPFQPYVYNYCALMFNLTNFVITIVLT